MIYLLIKGNLTDAGQAGIQRSVNLEETKCLNGRETHALVQDYYLEAVRHWYLEDAGAPLPYGPGSLLHYAVRSNAR